MLIKPTLRLALHFWKRLPFYSLKMAINCTELEIEKLNWIKVLKSSQKTQYIINFEKNELQCEIYIDESIKNRIANFPQNILVTTRKEILMGLFFKIKSYFLNFWKYSPLLVILILSKIILEIFDVAPIYFSPKIQGIENDCVLLFTQLIKNTFMDLILLIISFTIAVFFYLKSTHLSRIAHICRGIQIQSSIIIFYCVLQIINNLYDWQVKNNTPKSIIFYSLYTKKCNYQ